MERGVRQRRTGRRSRAQGAVVGVAEHVNTAVLVTVAGGELVDKRLVTLTAPGVPTHPHHHEGSWAVGRYLGTKGAKAVTLDEALALVRRVRAEAERGARRAFEAVEQAVETPIVAVALRAWPPLPDSIEARIADPRAQTFADSVMYREALRSAALAKGWAVHWYSRESVFEEAAAAVGDADLEQVLAAMGRVSGAPWRAAHKLAAASALAATGVRRH